MFLKIVKEAWLAYDDSRVITNLEDISAKVSTNHVYRLTFEDQSHIIAKLSYFGSFEHFVEDHTIINSLTNNLPAPFENFMATSLIKGTTLFVHRHTDEVLDAWVVFYRPIKIIERPPKRFDQTNIRAFAQQFAQFHLACKRVRKTLPPSTKTIHTDLQHLKEIALTREAHFMHPDKVKIVNQQIDIISENLAKLEYDSLEKIPVLTDWNIGNFSVDQDFNLFSRWDYDWFRISSRMMDFYFISRVVRNEGDQTAFSYDIDTFKDPNFIYFLKCYHEVYPLTKQEILCLKEMYRFFILNYVIKDGRYFFHEFIATKLLQEAFDQYFPLIDTFDAKFIIKALQL